MHPHCTPQVSAALWIAIAREHQLCFHHGQLLANVVLALLLVSLLADVLIVAGVAGTPDDSSSALMWSAAGARRTVCALLAHLHSGGASMVRAVCGVDPALGRQTTVAP